MIVVVVMGILRERRQKMSDNIRQAKECEICHEMKPLDEFSESYVNRCRACVIAKKRKGKANTEIIDGIKWERRTYELANCAMQAIIGNPVTFELMQKSHNTSTSIAKYAVETAREVVKRLKEVNNG